MRQARRYIETPRVIGIVLNRVASARGVFERFAARPDETSHTDAILLTGRIRPFDRDQLLEEWWPRIRAGRNTEPDKPLFVVATQTVEVGANIDFDALVTEAAPLDALRQRFGRLDRLGKRHSSSTPSPASIVIRSDHAKSSEDDPVYGSAIAETWKWLCRKDVASAISKGAGKRAIVDFGVNSLDKKVPQDPAAVMPLLAPARESPVLFPAHLDAWVQTNPRPDPDPSVAPFLHGRADAPADVLVVWRADLDAKRASSWRAIVSLMPPLTREALPVPIYEVQAWLKGQAGTVVADVEGAPVDASEAFASPAELRRVLKWRGKDDARVIGPDEVRPGDTIIVPAVYGGADRFGWHPDRAEPVEDVADRCLAQLIASYPTDAFQRLCPKTKRSTKSRKATRHPLLDARFRLSTWSAKIDSRAKYRDAAKNALEQHFAGEPRDAADTLAALASDLEADGDSLRPTLLDLTSGNQRLLQSFRILAGEPEKAKGKPSPLTRNAVEEALSGPWKYQDDHAVMSKALSLWQP